MAGNFFIGLDSDGCVLDTMASKQHLFLQPLFVKAFDLAPVAEVYQACADFVSLYSQTRGISRLRAILLTLTHFNRHPGRVAAGFPIIDTADLEAFAASGLPLSNAALKTWLVEHPSTLLERLLAWSEAVNAAILQSGVVFPVYEGARQALMGMKGRSTAGVVSQSPEQVLAQDWGAHGLLDYVAHVAGAEVGDKVAQLRTLTDGRFPRDHVLMVGDAPGDWQAAHSFGCRFFPIVPGAEEASWARFNGGIYEAFITGQWSREAEAAEIARFESALPVAPPWEEVAL